MNPEKVSACRNASTTAPAAFTSSMAPAATISSGCRASAGETVGHGAGFQLCPAQAEVAEELPSQGFPVRRSRGGSAPGGNRQQQHEHDRSREGNPEARCFIGDRSRFHHTPAASGWPGQRRDEIPEGRRIAQHLRGGVAQASSDRAKLVGRVSRYSRSCGSATASKLTSVHDLELDRRKQVRGLVPPCRGARAASSCACCRHCVMMSPSAAIPSVGLKVVHEHADRLHQQRERPWPVRNLVEFEPLAPTWR